MNYSCTFLLPCIVLAGEGTACRFGVQKGEKNSFLDNSLAYKQEMLEDESDGIMILGGLGNVSFIRWSKQNLEGHSVKLTEVSLHFPCSFLKVHGDPDSKALY